MPTQGRPSIHKMPVCIQVAMNKEKTGSLQVCGIAIAR